MVVNEEILGGLRIALGRGESMKKAMMTFFNAGYDTKEIEEAAKVLSGMHVEAPLPPPPVKASSGIIPPPPARMPQLLSAINAITSPQKVSGYGENKKDNGVPKKKIKLLLIILIAVFALSLAMLVITLLLR